MNMEASFFDMAKFLNWYSAHNAAVIQGLALVIFLLISLFIYRLFFISVEPESELNGFPFQKFEEKMTQLLDQQSKQNQLNNADPSNSSSVSSEEVLQLKAELENKKNEVETLKAQSGDMSPLNAKVKSYEQQIDELKNRLSDYEIIADDIADLQKYKSENEELKKLLESKETAGPEQKTETVSNQELSSNLVELKAEQPEVAAAVTEAAAESVEMDPGSLVSQNDLEDLLSDEPPLETSSETQITDVNPSTPEVRQEEAVNTLEILKQTEPDPLQVLEGDGNQIISVNADKVLEEPDGSKTAIDDFEIFLEKSKQ